MSEGVKKNLWIVGCFFEFLFFVWFCTKVYGCITAPTEDEETAKTVDVTEQDIAKTVDASEEDIARSIEDLENGVARAVEE